MRVQIVTKSKTKKRLKEFFGNTRYNDIYICKGEKEYFTIEHIYDYNIIKYRNVKDKIISHPFINTVIEITRNTKGIIFSVSILKD